jgi:RNA polymerase sigma-32 factor
VQFSAALIAFNDRRRATRWRYFAIPKREFHFLNRYLVGALQRTPHVAGGLMDLPAARALCSELHKIPSGRALSLEIIVMARVASRPMLGSDSGLQRYFAEIRRFPLLEPEEEGQLARRWRQLGDSDAVHRLVSSHLRLVAKLASGYRGYGLPISELVSEGNVGLMRAAQRFEPERGIRFSTYAIWWIKASIQAYIVRSKSLVKMGTTTNQKKLFFKLRAAKGRISANEEGDMRPDQVEFIAKELGVREEDVIEMNRRLGGDVSLNVSLLEDPESATWQDRLADEAPSQESNLVEAEQLTTRHKALTLALTQLNDRERRILEARRLAETPRKLEDLAVEFGVSPERVRQLEMRAFDKVKNATKRAFAVTKTPQLAIAC